MKNMLLIFAIIILQGCNEKTQDSVQKIINNYSFNSTVSSADKILIRPKKANQTNGQRNDTCFENKNILKAEKSEHIKKFEKLFVNSEYTPYCCCSETNYCLDFYDGTNKIDSYFVDTIEFKSKVRIFEAGFQYSYIIEKEKWRSFLNEIRSKK